MLVLAALTFGVGCLGFYLYYQNAWPILLSGPVLLYLCGYSLTKRFTKWSHYYLGSSLALSPLAAWLAIHPQSVGLPVVVLMLTVTCWVAGFDIMYACQDIEVDRREGLYSLPSRIGPGPALWLARGSHGAAILGLIMLGVVADLDGIYTDGAVVAGGLLVAQSALVRPGKYSQINLAFLPLNGLLSLIVGAAVVGDIFW
jgi:4-hydroxybenzoate polyprenyltransferase